MVTGYRGWIEFWSRSSYALAVRQCFLRVTSDWAPFGAAAGEEAEIEAMALMDAKLRNEAIGDEALRAQVEALMERYF